MYQSVVLTRWSAKRKRPYLISTNGMLDPWATRNSFWKKRLALLLYERRCLERAACIHVITPAEADSVRHFGLKGSICIIPNGVDLLGRFPTLHQTTFRGAVGKLTAVKCFCILDGSTQRRVWKRSLKAGVSQIWQKPGIGARDRRLRPQTARSASQAIDSKLGRKRANRLSPSDVQ